MAVTAIGVILAVTLTIAGLAAVGFFVFVVIAMNNFGSNK
jgi:hypothetical protein